LAVAVDNGVYNYQKLPKTDTNTVNLTLSDPRGEVLTLTDPRCAECFEN